MRRFCGSVQQPVDAASEVRQLRDLLIAGAAVDVALRLVASSTEFAAEEQVANAADDQALLQRLARKMRIATAVRLRAHIGQHLDGMLLQLPDEFLDGLRGMSDRVNESDRRSFLDRIDQVGAAWVPPSVLTVQ
jgi:hypothetical protein